MCQDCIRQWKENHAEAMIGANAHMDAKGIPEDSIMRGVVEMHLACNANPLLATVMERCWPTNEQLTQ